MLKKNDRVTVEIENLGNDGEGIGRADGYPLFIKDALPGDVVEAQVMKAKKNYAFARMDKLLSASPSRVEPVCPDHRRCGGCQLQALAYEKQLEYKEQKVREDLIRIGGLTDPKVLPIIGMEEPFHYRNKAQFPFGRDREGRTVTGFYAGRTHSIIPNTDCALGVTENQRILETILAYMEEFGVAPYEETTGDGLIRHALIRKAFATGELMVCLVLNGRSLPHAEELADRLFAIPGMTSFSLNVNEKRTNVILGTEVIPVRGRSYITDRIGEISYQISPLSFYQVNPAQTEKLYRTALDYADLKGTETVWDLYCGIGTISLFLAQKAGSVCGVEIVPQAIEDARRNAEINGIANAAFYVGKAEEVLPAWYREHQTPADVIVVDPPRRGCDPVCLETILAMSPERIVYVSCDPATLARDLKILCADGRYRLQQAQPVDMFPQTAGVETVCLLSNRKSDSKIKVDVDLEDYYKIKASKHPEE